MANQITDYLQRVTPGINFTKTAFYTPTFFGLGTGVVNPNSIQASWRRVDEFLHLHFSFNLQTAGSGADTISFSLPTGMTIDFAKIIQPGSPLGSYVGTGMLNSLASNAVGFFGNPNFNDRIFIVKNGLVPVTGVEWNSGAAEGYAFIPIVGWN